MLFRFLSITKRRLASHKTLSVELIAGCATEGFTTAYGLIPRDQWTDFAYRTDCLIGVAHPGGECVIRMSSENSFVPLYSQGGGVVGDPNASALFRRYMDELVPPEWRPDSKMPSLGLDRQSWQMFAEIVLDRIIEESVAESVGGVVQVATITRHGGWQYDSAAGRRPELPPNMKWVSVSLEDRKSTRLNSSHIQKSRMPSSA